MAYRITYKASVARDLSKLDKAAARRILNRLEKDLAGKADSYPALKGKFAGLRKYPIGEYGVIFAIVSSAVQVLRIGHRRDIHKKEI